MPSLFQDEPDEEDPGDGPLNVRVWGDTDVPLSRTLPDTRLDEGLETISFI